MKRSGDERIFDAGVTHHLLFANSKRVMVGLETLSRGMEKGNLLTINHS